MAEIIRVVKEGSVVRDEATRNWLRHELVREARIYLDDPTHSRFVAFVLRHPQGLLSRFYVLEEELYSLGIARTGAMVGDQETRHPITTLAQRLGDVTPPWGGDSSWVEIQRERARVALDRLAASPRGRLEAACSPLSMEAQLRKTTRLTIAIVARIVRKPYPTLSQWVRKHDKEVEEGGQKICRVRERDGYVLELWPLLSMLRERGVDLSAAENIPAHP